MERQSSPVRPAVVLVVAAIATVGVGWLVLLTMQGRIPRSIAVGVVELLLVALFSALALVVVRVGLVYAMDRRIDAGDYDGTIRLAGRFQGWWPRWAGSYMQKSSALIYAGRFVEAEALLVEASSLNLKDEAAKILMRSFLGSVFLEQRRYQEARAAFRGPATEPDGSPKEVRTLSADLGLAEVEIRSGGNLETALNYAMEGIRTGGQLYRKFEPDGYARARDTSVGSGAPEPMGRRQRAYRAGRQLPARQVEASGRVRLFLSGADGDGNMALPPGRGPTLSGAPASIPMDSGACAVPRLFRETFRSGPLSSDRGTGAEYNAKSGIHRHGAMIRAFSAQSAPPAG